MTKSSSILIVLALTLVIGAGTLIAQQPAGRARAASTGGNSAHETTSATFGGARDNRVTITYGRPVARGRVVFGELVKWGDPWRLGSDEATLLLTQKNLEIGGTAVPAGAYTLYLVPAESGATKLAISKKLGGWGVPVDVSQDLARVDVTKTAIDTPVEQLTIAIKPTQGAPAGTLEISWEKTQFSVPFTIK